MAITSEIAVIIFLALIFMFVMGFLLGSSMEQRRKDPANWKPKPPSGLDG